MKNLQMPNRLYSLDILRGVASLIVVLFHWTLLTTNFENQLTLTTADLPFYDPLYLFYAYGNKAVNLFFCISGFIFFWLYADKIAMTKVSFKDFSFLRLSRLYPLHFLTLILVTIGQLCYISMTGKNFGFAVDGYHFLLNLGFISSWGFEDHTSFNGPIWSVSIEILLYITFFAFCRLLPKQLIILFIASLLGHFVISELNITIGVGVESFFMGGCAYVFFEKLLHSKYASIAFSLLPIITIVVWLLTIAFAIQNSPFELQTYSALIKKVLTNSLNYIVFPLTILSLAICETKRNNLGKPLAFLGDISYSTYLLHFPLMLLSVIAISVLALNPVIIYSGWFLCGFFITLIAVSLLSYHYFERPMQQLLRSKLLPRK